MTDRKRRRLLGFPETVNEVAARLVAGGVVLMSLSALVLRQHWLLIPLAYGFWARVLTGPRLSPLALLVTRVVVPRLDVPERPVPGPPKRFAQGIGATCTSIALIAYFGFGLTGVADVILAMMVVFATLESVFALCVGCRIFALLMRAGVIPAEVCAACNNLDLRQRATA
jgi:hypothetical protein